MEDALCIAALFRCLCRCLYRCGVKGRRFSNYPLLLLNENRWRAQRYGLGRGFIDLTSGAVVASAQLLEDLLELVREDAEHFGCTREVDHARVILARGTSADRQLALYRQQVTDGLSPPHALSAVVDQLITETVAGAGNRHKRGCGFQPLAFAAVAPKGGRQ
jgi:carboxylate-amine ligase